MQSRGSQETVAQCEIQAAGRANGFRSIARSSGEHERASQLTPPPSTFFQWYREPKVRTYRWRS